MISRLMLEMLAGYESLLRRVKASGDRTVALETVSNLKALGGVYRGLQQLGVVTPQERQFFQDYAAGLEEAAETIEFAQRKVGGLLRKATKEQRALASMQRRVASMSRLKLDEASFFDSPDRRETSRRKRAVDRQRRR